MTELKVGEIVEDDEYGEIIVVEMAGCRHCVIRLRAPFDRCGHFGECRPLRSDRRSVQFVPKATYVAYKLTGVWDDS